jgi:EmrB/QacA subfamily drug resistance transporter
MNGKNGLLNGKNGGSSTLVLFLLASIAVMVMYVESMAFPSLKQVMEDFGLAASDLALASWIITIYLVVGAVAIPIFGKLGDIYGKKKLLSVAMLIYSVAVTLTGFSRDISDSIYVMIGFRAFQGLGMSMFPLAFSIIRDEFPRERMAIAQGVVSAMFGVGTAVGFVVGGWVTDAYGWQWTYHTVAPFAFIATVIVALKVRESPVRLKAKVDYLGSALLGITLFTFLVGVTEGKNRGWTDPLILALFAISAVSVLAFSYWQTKAKDPLVRPSLMKQRDIALTNIVGFMIGFALFTANQTIAILATFNFGLDATDTGLLMVPMSVVTLFLGPTVGFIVKRQGPKWPLVFGLILSIIGFMLLYQWHDTKLQIMLNVMVMGGGSAFAMVGSINMLIISTPKVETGISTAVNTILRTVGGVVGPALAAVIISSNSSLVEVAPGVFTEVPETSAYHIIFFLASVFMAVGIGAALFLTNKQATAEEPMVAPAKPVQG